MQSWTLLVVGSVIMESFHMEPRKCRLGRCCTVLMYRPGWHQPVINWISAVGDYAVLFSLKLVLVIAGGGPSGKWKQPMRAVGAVTVWQRQYTVPQPAASGTSLMRPLLSPISN